MLASVSAPVRSIMEGGCTAPLPTTTPSIMEGGCIPPFERTNPSGCWDPRPWTPAPIQLPSPDSEIQAVEAAKLLA